VVLGLDSDSLVDAVFAYQCVNAAQFNFQLSIFIENELNEAVVSVQRQPHHYGKDAHEPWGRHLKYPVKHEHDYVYDLVESHGGQRPGKNLWE